MTKNHLTNALMAALLLTFTWLPPATAQEAGPTVKTDSQETRASLTVPAREEANPKPAEGSAKEEKAGGQDSIVEQKPDAKAAETEGADGEGTDVKTAETKGADGEGTGAKTAETQGADEAGTGAKAAETQGADEAGTDAKAAETEGQNAGDEGEIPPEEIEKAIREQFKPEFIRLLTGPPLDVESRHFYDALSVFFSGLDDKGGDKKRLGAIETLKIALANSIEVRDARSRANEAFYRVDEVKSVKNVKLSGSGLVTYSQPINSINMNGNTITMGEEWNWSAGVSADYLITNFGLFEDTKRAAWLAYISTKLDEERLTEDLYNKVLSSYLTTLELNGLYIVSQSAVEVRKSQLDIAKAKYEEGVSPKYDMLTTQVNLKMAEQTLITAKKSLELSKSELKRIMGAPQTEDFEVSKPPYIQLPSPDLEESIMKAYDKRPEMTQINLAVEIAKTNEAIATQGKNPTVAWTASYMRQNETTSKRDYTWSSGIALNIPILDGGSARAKRNQAREVVKQTELKKEDLERNIAFQIKDAILKMEESKQKLITAEASMDMAKEAYKTALVRYQESVGTFLELDDATTSYLTSLASVSSAYCDYQRSILNMLYSMGIIVEEVDKYEIYLQQNK